MSKSSPSDLATAFRSFTRRLGEALGAVEGDPAAQDVAGPHAARVRSAVESAAALLGTPVTSDLATTGSAVAEHIVTTDADRWDDATLDRLRALAQDAGTALRAIDALAR